MGMGSHSDGSSTRWPHPGKHQSCLLKWWVSLYNRQSRSECAIPEWQIQANGVFTGC